MARVLTGNTYIPGHSVWFSAAKSSTFLSKFLRLVLL